MSFDRSVMKGETITGELKFFFFGVEDIERALDRVRNLGGCAEEVDLEGDEEHIARFGHFALLEELVLAPCPDLG